MKQKFVETLKVPEGAACTYEDGVLVCKQGDVELKKTLDYPHMQVAIKGNEVTLTCPAGNKRHYAYVNTYRKHVQNMFLGLKEPFVYSLEIAHVHFPMTVKVDGDKVSVTNFLGEKTPRFAKILPGVQVEIKENIITVTSNDKEAAGQTAANLERATRLKGRDRRIFQDGIYITEKSDRKVSELDPVEEEVTAPEKEEGPKAEIEVEAKEEKKDG
ncbi:50S ribosomal protein L6 [Candidatus Pacearchaeota archaeon]|nr:50S ribosomal protein L6 [Candidatus Pacearchaeota archaeon]